MANKAYSIKKFSNLVSRRDYTKITNNFDGPNLLAIQKESFKKFLNYELKNIISSYFPITSIGGRYRLELDNIFLDEPKKDPSKCREEGKTYNSELYVSLNLIDNSTGEVKTFKKNNKSKFNGMFFANIPIMTKKGTFIVNGIEKIVISQILRSPGAYMFSKSQMKLNNSRKRSLEGYICEILPSKGTLFQIFISHSKSKRYFQIMFRNSSGDSSLIITATEFLKALGLSEEEILLVFDNNELIIETLKHENYNQAKILTHPYIVNLFKSVTENPEERGARNIETRLRSLVYQISMLDKNPQSIQDKSLRNDLINQLIAEKAAKDIVEALSISTRSHDARLRVTGDKNTCYQTILYSHFFTKNYFDLSSAGRYKMIRKLRLTERLYLKTIAEDLLDKKGQVIFKKGTLITKNELEIIKKLSKDKTLANKIKLEIKNGIKAQQYVYHSGYEKIRIYVDNEKLDSVIPIIGVDNEINLDTLTMSDLISIISYVINLSYDIGDYDDIDHLGNKRIRLIEELLGQKCQVGLAKLEKFINDKLASFDGANNSEEEKRKVLTVNSIINVKPFQIAIKDFFNSHQLIQFIDQQNPLSELTNKRRISAMGPGGISREDPNLDIRDVHYSQYGKICPIETPEGMNIGLIMSLATYSKIDENGFIITPYWKVKNGVITNECEWLTALKEDEYVIATCTKNVVNNRFTDDKVLCRFRSSLEFIDVNKVDYVDISPKQVVSIAASCIPFLENNDANRALMGANMQRQATPLIKPHAPIVGTGNEFKIAHDSGMALVYEKDEDAIVKYVDGQQIILDTNGKNETYYLNKFLKSNQCTCNNQTPIVSKGERIVKNQMIADGPAIQNGELALGQNILVAFTTWGGYNYEDAIILSDRLIKEDIYTSIHITEHTIECLRTKNGDEEITRDLPNVSESSKRFLDQDGIIMVGAEIREGDILVGKISPKGQVDLTPEEKLLQSIFGEKTKSHKETSLKVPHGGEGTVAMVRRFRTSDNYELDDDVIEQIKVYIVQKRKIQIGDKMAGRHGNKGIVSKIVPIEDMPHLEDGTPIDVMLNPLGVPSRMNIGQILEIHLGLSMWKLTLAKVLELIFNNADYEQFRINFGIMPEIGKNLAKNVLKILKDKKIDTLNEAKKKFTEIDFSIALSQTGISRDDLVYKVATPVFEGVEINDLEAIMKEAGICPITSLEGQGKDGKFKLINGITGEYFDGNISIGIMYMLKLDHMVDDKIHARSVGSYSKITQQPLGGKSQNGGQRFGEMEVWALQAYGAAYNLREILTIKSDDVKGRNNTYNSIIKAKPLPPYGIPESFKLLTKQLQGLGLRVEVTTSENDVQDINSYITKNYDQYDDELSSSFYDELGLKMVKEGYGE